MPSATRRAASIRSPMGWRGSAARPSARSPWRSADPEPRVRRGAALALGQIRPLAPGTVQTLATGLADPDAEVRAAFLDRHRSPRPARRRDRAGGSCPAPRRIRGDPKPGHRGPLQVRGPRRPTARGPHGHARRPRCAGAAAGHRHPPFPGSAGAEGPDGHRGEARRARDLEVRLAAAEWIGSHGQAAAEAVPALIALLDDPTPELRTVAALTLGKLGKCGATRLRPARLRSWPPGTPRPGPRRH